MSRRRSKSVSDLQRDPARGGLPVLFVLAVLLAGGLALVFAGLRN